MEIQLFDRAPTPEEYCALRKACGLSEMSIEAAEFGADVDWLYEKFGFGKPEQAKGMFYKRPG